MARKKTAAKRKPAPTTAPVDQRTGYRKPINYLKMWGDPDWSRQLTPRLHVGMVDEELPVSALMQGEQPVIRKSWYLALTQPKAVAKTIGRVRGLPAGTSVVLFEDDVLELVNHLADSWLIRSDDDGRLWNGKVLETQRRQGRTPRAR